jgi:hypothetical protein
MSWQRLNCPASTAQFTRNEAANLLNLVAGLKRCFFLVSCVLPTSGTTSFAPGHSQPEVIHRVVIQEKGKRANRCWQGNIFQ